MITLEEIKNKKTRSGKKQFITKIGKWLIYDRNEHYYLIVNTDVDEIEIPTFTINKTNFGMENPMAWYLDKSIMKPWKLPKKKYQKEVIDYINSIEKENTTEKENKKKVKGFWDFFKK